VQPSSLIFLILIAIWAAYLLQHWVRRREHLATARSVDRFSDAMRVLERRTPLPALDLSAARPRSYAVSPARPSRPQVAVKPVQPARPQVPARPAPAVRPTRIFHVLAGVSARRVRGLTLLVSLLAALVVPPLAFVSLVPWWSVLVVVAVLVVDVGWLRKVAVSERVAGRAQARTGGSAAGEERWAGERFSYFESENEHASELGARPEHQVASPGGAAAVSEPIESPVEADPSGWAPVPVPPPTYTLKAKAPEPVPVPEPVPEPLLDAVTELSESECWSLEGMVYDCDLDELVERRSGTGA
jgi:membrane protein implicated in regulation of membrane protease activity